MQIISLELRAAAETLKQKKFPLPSSFAQLPVNIGFNGKDNQGGFMLCIAKSKEEVNRVINKLKAVFAVLIYPDDHSMFPGQAAMLDVKTFSYSDYTSYDAVVLMILLKMGRQRLMASDVNICL